MTMTQFAALIGFAFVGVWVFDGFGAAVLCLVGAAVFALAMAVARGQLDLERLRDEVGRGISANR